MELFIVTVSVLLIIAMIFIMLSTPFAKKFFAQVFSNKTASNNLDQELKETFIVVLAFVKTQHLSEANNAYIELIHKLAILKSTDKKLQAISNFIEHLDSISTFYSHTRLKELLIKKAIP